MIAAMAAGIYVPLDRCTLVFNMCVVSVNASMTALALESRKFSVTLLTILTQCEQTLVCDSIASFVSSISLKIIVCVSQNGT